MEDGGVLRVTDIRMDLRMSRLPAQRCKTEVGSSKVVLSKYSRFYFFFDFYTNFVQCN